MQINIYPFISYSNLVVIIPPQKMFKMFPHISEEKDTDFPKADMWNLQ